MSSCRPLLHVFLLHLVVPLFFMYVMTVQAQQSNDNVDVTRPTAIEYQLVLKSDGWGDKSNDDKKFKTLMSFYNDDIEGKALPEHTKIKTGLLNGNFKQLRRQKKFFKYGRERTLVKWEWYPDTEEAALTFKMRNVKSDTDFSKLVVGDEWKGKTSTKLETNVYCTGRSLDFSVKIEKQNDGPFPVFATLDDVVPYFPHIIELTGLAGDTPAGDVRDVWQWVAENDDVHFGQNLGKDDEVKVKGKLVVEVVYKNEAMTEVDGEVELALKVKRSKADDDAAYDAALGGADKVFDFFLQQDQWVVPCENGGTSITESQSSPTTSSQSDSGESVSDRTRRDTGDVYVAPPSPEPELSSSHTILIVLGIVFAVMSVIVVVRQLTVSPPTIIKSSSTESVESGGGGGGGGGGIDDNSGYRPPSDSSGSFLDRLDGDE